MQPFRKILAMKLRSLGDTVILTSSLEELRKAYPTAEIHVAVTKPWDKLMENNPNVNRIWAYDRYEDKVARARAVTRLGLQLAKQGFDCVVNFHASPSSAMLSFATRAAHRSIHFHGHRDKNRFSTYEVPGKGKIKPIVERDLDALRAMGLRIPEGDFSSHLPHIYLTAAEKQAAENYLAKEGIKKPLLVLGLGSSRPTKCWPLDRFAQVSLKWKDQTGGSVLAVVSRDEQKLADQFLAKLGSNQEVHVAIDLELRLLSSVMHAASVFLGNDSGPKHIAVASGLPTVTLFGPEHPFEWHPYPKDRHPYFFIENLACRRDADPGMPPWCGLNICEIEGHKCLLQIGVDEVFNQLMKIRKPSA